MSARLEGKVALVTGGRGGIGRAICDRFVREGAFVFTGDLSETGSMETADDAPNGTFIKLDVTNEASVQDAIAVIENAHGRLDVLVNAAGIEIEKTIEDTSLDDWNWIFATNVTGTFLTSKYALSLLRKSTGASIINFGSYDGFIADPKLAAYCATKGAVHALTRAMACDHSPEGIRVNAICPGYVDTPMMQSFIQSAGTVESLQQEIHDVHPLKTCGTPEDMANLVLWLASDEARYASGQLWVLDGGMSAQVQQMKINR